MKQQGFTLIELMVAITVLVLIVTIVFISLASVTDTAAVARANTERIHLQQFLWRHLTTNLNAVYIDPGAEEPSFALESGDEEGPYGPADTLTFCTGLAMDGPLALPGVLKVVQYEVTDPDLEAGQGADGTVLDDAALAEEGPRRVLRITERPLVLSDFSAIQQSEEHAELEELDPTQEYAQIREIPIASFNLTFFDGEDWVDSWATLETGMLPWAVRVQANFMRTEEERSADLSAGIDLYEEADLDLVVSFPMGAGVLSPWVDMNHSRLNGADYAVGPDGMPLDPGMGDDDGSGGGIGGNPNKPIGQGSFGGNFTSGSGR